VQLRTMAATVAELNNTIAHLTAENVNLRRQLAYACAGRRGTGGDRQLAPGECQLGLACTWACQGRIQGRCT